ncbi:hypothetical protein SAMN05720762_10437 [Fibrobacter sp. UWH4]|nr:hypothetical protein SAMN05720762_10437 [Fibrobacter sp. UWH4]
MAAHCPYCQHELSDSEVRSIHSQMTGSRSTPTSAENGRKYGGRPKGAKNRAPRADKGLKRGPRSKPMQ